MKRTLKKLAPDPLFTGAMAMVELGVVLGYRLAKHMDDTYSDKPYRTAHRLAWGKAAGEVKVGVRNKIKQEGEKLFAPHSLQDDYTELIQEVVNQVKLNAIYHPDTPSKADLMPFARLLLKKKEELYGQ